MDDSKSHGNRDGARLGRADGPVGDDGVDELQRLRELLAGPDRDRLRRLERQVRHLKPHARDVSRVLPDAMLMHDARDGRLAAAMEDHVGKAMEHSVRRNPAPIRDALLPVIGPLIRKSIRSALAQMLENLNRALEYSFTIKGLRWRWEAFRTGRPFSEVVLLNSLKYRVEQLYLIHRGSGLLLLHVADGSVQIRDPDMVSAMLTAIRDFVQDSFDTPEGSDIASVQIGDFRLVVHADERAVLAAVVRGMPPEGLARRLLRTLERISTERGADLEEFEGDVAPFRAARPLLEDHLEVELHDDRRPWPIATVVLGIIGMILAAWLIFWSSARYFSNAEWSRAFELLRAEPGIHISSTERLEGRWIVTGLMDRDARELDVVLAPLTVDLESARFDLESYISLDDAVSTRRALRRLEPPVGVEFRVEGGILSVRGLASEGWIAKLERDWSLVAGTDQLDTTELVSAESVADDDR